MRSATVSLIGCVLVGCGARAPAPATSAPRKDSGAQSVIDAGEEDAAVDEDATNDSATLCCSVLSTTGAGAAWGRPDTVVIACPDADTPNLCGGCVFDQTAGSTSMWVCNVAGCDVSPPLVIFKGRTICMYPGGATVLDADAAPPCDPQPRATCVASCKNTGNCCTGVGGGTGCNADNSCISSCNIQCVGDPSVNYCTAQCIGECNMGCSQAESICEAKCPPGCP